jgi:hypothetical protein
MSGSSRGGMLRSETFSRAGRSVLILVAGLAACVGYALFLNPIYPIVHWLFWTVAAIWSWDLYLSVSCVSFGYFVLRRILKLTELPRLETLSFSVTLGAIGFVLGMYIGGFLRLYGPVFAVAMPAVLLLIGLPHARQRLPTIYREVNAGAKIEPWAVAATVFGTLALGVLYLGLLTPNAVNYDASWNHLVIAQDYARNGRIVPFPADWVKNVPHLGSIVNTWAFLVPGLFVPAQRYMMALHNEFTFFLWTLVGVAALVRWATDRQELRGAWAAFFLFPSIFVYDGNMGAAADHYLAFFSAPLVLATVRAFRRFDRGACILTGAIAAGALLTKLHAIYLLVPIGVVLTGRLGYLLLQTRRAGGGWPEMAPMVKGAAALLATSAVVVSPHFGSNLVFYKNPFYPLAQDIFTASTPGVPEAALQMKYLFQAWGWHPPTELWPRIKTTIEMIFTIPFHPQYGYNGERPTFGSLFSLSLILVPFVRADARGRRLWFLVAMCVGALGTWAFTFRVDRNLQTFLPVLVAGTAAILIRAWEVGFLARVGVAALVAIQLVWGADLYFSGSDRISDSIALIRSGLDGQAKHRFAGARRDYVALGRSLPKDAVVLMHNWHPMLGIDRTVLLDWIGFQGLIDYRPFKTPRDVYNRFRELGVTQMVTLPTLQRPAASKQENILFDTFAAFYGTAPRDFGELKVYDMPDHPPPEQSPFRVAVRGMYGYADGVYPIEALGVCEEYPPQLQHFPGPEIPLSDDASFAAQLGHVDAVLLGGGARGSVPLPPEMIRVGGKGNVDVFARRASPN